MKNANNKNNAIIKNQGIEAGKKSKNQISVVQPSSASLLSIQQVADQLGVSTKTLRRWEDKGFIKADRTIGNQRRYNASHLKDLQERVKKASKNQKTASNEADLVSLRDSLIDRSDTLNGTLSQNSRNVNSQTRDVDLPGVEPGRPGVSNRSSEPAKPTPFPSYQLNKLYARRLKTASIFLGVIALAVTGAILTGSGTIPGLNGISGIGQQKSSQPVGQSTDVAAVLAATNKIKGLLGEITFNIPSIFNDKVTINADTLLNGNATVSGTLTAPNIVYSLLPGTNISITGDPQNPTISAEASGVTSLGGQTGELDLEGGTGITINDLEISLTSNSVNITAGSGLSGGGPVALGGAISLSNAGVTSVIAGTGIAVSGSTGAVTISTTATGVAIKEGGSTVTSAASTLDFLGGDFDIGESPPGEANVQLASILTSVTGVAGDFAINGGDLTTPGGLNITPSGALVIGSTGQSATLQGSNITIAETGGGFTTTLGFSTPTANVNLNFPALAGGPYDICTSSGNCAGGAGGSKWTDAGAFTFLSNTTDSVTIGSAVELAKLAIDGDDDQIQLLVQGNATQTNFLAVFENSAGVDQFTIANNGNIVAAGNITSATLDTGQGANELYAMNQNVLTTSTVTFDTLNLTNDLTVANGGTGGSTFTQGGVLYGNAASAIGASAQGVSGQCLLSGGTGSPTWSNCTPTADITAVGNITSGDAFTSGVPGAELYFADNGFLGLGGAAGRIEFDDLATDEVNILGTNVGIGTSTPNQQLEITGNFRLPNSTATTGIIYSGADRFIHNFGGTSNFFAGVNAGNLTTSGSANVAIGFEAGLSLTSGSDNALFGYRAGDSLTTGGTNVLIGEVAGATLTTESENTFLGYCAGCVSTSQNSTFIGSNAGRSATGNENVFIGQEAGRNSTTGTSNVYIGNSAGRGSATNTGSQNTFIGYSSGDVNSSGSDNVFLGTDAGGVNTTGSFNTIIGSNAGSQNNTGGSNVILGYDAEVTGNQSSSIVLGREATTSLSNALVIGSTTSPINEFYIGRGVTAAAPSAISINATGGSGTNIAGANLQLAGGKGTGNAAGGDILFQTSDAGGSGSTLQSLTTKMIITETGNVGIGDASPLSALTVGSGDLFQVNSSGAIAAATGFTQNSGVFSATLTTTNAATFGSTTAGSDILAFLPQSAITTASFTGTVTTADLTGNKTFILPNTTAASDTICLVAQGNCAGSGTGVTTPGGTTNRLAKFTGAQTIGDAGISDASDALAITIDSSENVGIGDASPLYLLTVGSGDLFGVNSSGNIVWEGATADAFELILAAGDVGLDSTVTLPAPTTATDTVCLLTLANCTGAGSSSTLQAAYNADVDGSDAIIALTAADDSLIFRNPAASGTDSTYLLTLDQLATGTTGGLFINSLGADANFALRVDDSSSDTSPFVIDNTGRVGIGLTNPSEQLQITGNFRLPNSTATTGIIYSGADRFIHNFGGGSDRDDVFIGVKAGNLTTTGEANIGIGYEAGLSLTDGSNHILIGREAGRLITGGNGNIVIGSFAGDALTTGQSNIIIGYLAGSAATSSNNVLIGDEAGETLSTGADNTLVGADAGDALTTGSSNTFFGKDAGGGGNGSNNTFIGEDAGDSGTVGSFNTVLGSDAGTSTLNGSNNVLLGYDTEVGSGFSNSIAIGMSATATAGNQLVIGSSTSSIIDAYIGNGVTASAPSAITLNASGGSGTNIAGANLQLAAGKATGNAAGGDILFQTSDVLGSGSTLQSLTTKMILTETGNVGIGDTTPSSRLEVGDGTDSLQISSVGDLLFVDADGAASITGPAGGALGILSGSGQDLTLTASDDIIFDDAQLTTGLNLTAADTAINVNLTQGIVDAINDLYDLGTSGGGSSIWSRTSNVIHPTTLTDDFTIGGSTLAASIFGIDESAGDFYFGYDNTANPTLRFEATDGDAGEFGFNTNDAFFFSNANVGIGTTAPSTLLNIVHPNIGNVITLGTVSNGERMKIYVDSNFSQISSENGNHLHLYASPSSMATSLSLLGSGNKFVGINDVAPDYTLEVHNPDTLPTLALSDDDITHGVTDAAQTDVVLHMSAISATDGGAQITGISDNVNTAQALSIRGILGNTPDDTVPAIKLIGAKGNGTAIADLAAAETLFQVANNDDAAALTILGNGNVGIGTAVPLINVGSSNGDYSSVFTGAHILGATNGIMVIEGNAGLARLHLADFDGTLNKRNLTLDYDNDRLDFNALNNSLTTTRTIMTLMHDGNVGIGTTSPDSKLHIVGGGICIENTETACTAGAGDLAVNGGDLTTDQTTFNLLNATATTINFAGGATTALNIGSTTTGLNTFNTDVNFALTDTENLNLASTVTGTNALDLINATITNQTSGGTQRGIVFTNANDAGTTESLILIDNADVTSGALSDAIRVTATGGTNTITNALNIAFAIGSSGNGINLSSGVSGGDGIKIAGVTSGTGINFSANITGGTGIDLASITTGATGINASVNALTSGTGITFGGSGTADTTFTGDVIRISPSRTVNTTRNHSGNMLDISRTNIINGGGQTLTVSGDVATFASTCTQTAGTCTDTANILELTQSYANASGAVLNVLGAGTGNLATFDGSNTTTSANGVLIDVGSSTSSTYALNVTSNNGATQGLYVRADGNVGIGTTVPSQKLEVAGSIVTRGGSVPSLFGSGTITAYNPDANSGAGSGTYVQIPDQAGAFGGFALGYGTTPKWLYGISKNITDTTALVFYEDALAANARLTIATGGNVGIGDASPAYLLTVGSGDLFGIDSSANTQLTWEGSAADAFETILTVVNPTADLTYRLADATAGTYDLCSTAGNCAGVAGNTLQAAYNADDNSPVDAIIALTAADDSLIFRNPASGGTDSTYLLTLDQLATGSTGGLFINSLGADANFALRVDDSSGDTSPFVITNTGDVGVGTTSPASGNKLHVEGQCVAAGTLIRRRRRRRHSGEDDEDDSRISMGDPGRRQDDGYIEEDIAVEDILPGDEVLSLNDQTGEFEWHTVEKTMDMGIQKVFGLTTESGKSIKTTGNHPYLRITEKDYEENVFKNQKTASFETVSGDLTRLGIATKETALRIDSNIANNENFVNPENQTRGVDPKGIEPSRPTFVELSPKPGGPTPDILLHNFAAQVKKAAWTKVHFLRVGEYIATVDGFEKITGIKEIKPLQTYDLQIEGTHNFVAGHYINSRTGKALTEKQEKLYLEYLKIQKTASSEADLVSLKDSLIDRFKTLNENLSQSSQNVNNQTKDVDLPGVEPGRPGILNRSSKPAKPTSQSLSQILGMDVNEADIVYGGIVAHNTYISGNVGIGDTTPDAQFDIDSLFTTGTVMGITSSTLTTGDALDITTTHAPTSGTNQAIDLNLTFTPTSTASTFAGIDLSLSEGINSLANTTYGLKLTNSNAANTSTGTHTIYGGHFTTTGKTLGATTAVGLYATASGADNNYAAIFESGNVGIGTTAPAEQLEITGNFRLPTGTGSVGIIYSNTSRFIHTAGGTTNFFAGVNAGNLSATGTLNTGLGTAALSALTSGTSNIAIGREALDALTNGDQNIAIGNSALGANNAGQSVAVGSSALVVATGGSNTGVGRASLNATTTGTENTALGHNIGQTNTTGTKNTLIGASSDVASNNLTNATAIGYSAIVGASNSLVLGGTGANAVSVGIGTTSPAGILHVAGQCVTGDTLLPIKRRKKRSKIKDQRSKMTGPGPDPDDLDHEDWEDLLIPIKDVLTGDLVASLDETTGKIVYRPIKQLVDKGFQSVVKLTTSSGRSIETTKEHPYLVEGKGWKKVSQLKVGTKIAVTTQRSLSQEIENQDGRSAVNYEELFNSNIIENHDQQESDYNEQISNTYLKVGVQNVGFFDRFHNVLRVNAITNESIVSKMLNVKARSFFDRLAFDNLGLMNATANQAAPIFTQNSEITDINAGLPFMNQTLADGNPGVNLEINYEAGNKKATVNSVYVADDMIADHMQIVKDKKMGRTRLSDSSLDIMDKSYQKGVDLSSEKIVYEEIVSIEETGRKEVYDIEVEGTHNFVGNDIVAHNTSIFGAGEGGTPTVTTLRGAAAAGSNIAGANFTFDASNGTGTGGSGALIFRTAPVAGSSSTANTLTERMRIDSSGNVGIGDTTPSSRLEVGDGTDSLQISSVGDLLFVDADGAASITGPAGGTLTLAAGAGQDLALTAADDITFDDLQLTSPLNLTAADTAINVNLTQAVVDAINDLYDLTTGGGTGAIWSRTSSVIHPTTATDDLAIGGTTVLGSMFGIDESAGNFYFGYDNTANPTLNFEATDTDAGEFGFNTDDSFYFSNASVGIGITNPTTSGAKLYVSGGDIFNTNSGGNPRLLLGDGLSASEWGSIRWSSANDNVEIGTQAGGVSTLVISENANVGIGTTSPGTFKLQVAGSVGPETNDLFDLGSNSLRWKDLYLGGDTLHIGTSTTDEGTLSYNTTTNIFDIGTDGTTNGDIAFFTDDLYLDKSAGFVGVGTTAPVSILHAAGTVTVNQNLMASTAPTYSTTSQTITSIASGTYDMSSTAIGADGLPVISLYDSTNTTLVVVKCGNSACSSGNTTTVVDGNTGCPTGCDTDSQTGQYTSIGIGTDGFPIISYYEAFSDNGTTASNDLRVVKCGNASCSSGNIYTSVDTSIDSGSYNNLAIGKDGFPVISYLDNTNGDLELVKCGNAACSSGNTITTLDSTIDVAYTSIAIGIDGFPIISYYDSNNGDLELVKCGNAACSSGNTLTTLESTSVTGTHSSIAIGVDGLPVISYLNATAGELKAVKCGNSACSSGNKLSIIAATLFTTSTPDSLAIGADGLPLISYKVSSVNDFYIAHCGDPACSSGNTLSAVQTTQNVGTGSSIAIGADGLPFAVYQNSTLANFSAVKCSDYLCSAVAGSSLANGSNIGSNTDPFRSLYFETLNFGKEDARLVLNDQGNIIANNLFSNANGNVGIGDQSPDAQFDIDSNFTTGNVMGITSSTLTSGSLLDITSAGTGALTNQKGLNISLSGTNSTSAQTTYGAYISNTHAGTTSTNIGLYATATGGTTANYAAIFDGGNVGIGTTSPAQKLHVEGQCVTGDTLLKRRRKRKGARVKGKVTGPGPDPDKNQKTASDEADLVNLTDSLDDWLDTLNGNVSQNSQHVNPQNMNVDLPGVEPGRLGVSSQSSKPAKPTPLSSLADSKNQNQDWVWEDYWEDVRIDQIQPGDEILSLNEETGQFVPRHVNGLKDMGIQEVFLLTTQRSHLRIETTENHPFLVLQKTEDIHKKVNRKLMTFEVDQSNRIEEKNKDTIIALANKEKSFALRLTRKDKRRLRDLYKKEPKLFGPSIFAYLIAEAIAHAPFAVSRLIIDEEYDGYKRNITRIINAYYPGMIIEYRSIGKNSPAHEAAYFAHEKKTGVGSNLKGFPTAELLHTEFTAIRNPRGLLLPKDYHNLSALSMPAKNGRKLTKWVKVKHLKPGMTIATQNGWEKISGKYPRGYKQTYDIEVMGTHNFVGNGIVAHNTYINSTAITANVKGLEVTQSGAVSGTGYGGYFSKTGASTTNVGLYSTATGATNNYAAIFEAGNVGIGTTTPGSKLVVRTAANENLRFVSASVIAGGATGIGIQSINDAANAAQPLVIGGSTTTFWNGNVGVADLTPDYLFELLDESNTPTLGLSDDDIGHGVTTLAQTDTFLHLTSISTTDGGALLTALADNVNTAQALSIRGILGNTPDDTVPAIKLIGAKGSGTGIVDLAAAETVFQVANNATNLLTVLGSGNMGIRTSSPDAPFEIEFGGYAARFSTSADNPRLAIYVDNNTSILETFSGNDLSLTTSTGTTLTLDGATTNVGISDLSPDYQLEIHNPTTTPTFGLSDDDIAHGVTDLAQTDTFFHLSSLSTTDGGAQLTAIADNVAGAQAFSLRAVLNSDPTDTVPAIKFTGHRASGTGVADLAAAETLFQVANNDDASALTILGNGNVGIGTTGPTRTLDVVGSQGGNVVTDSRATETTAATYTVSTKALAYYLSSNSTTTDSTFTTTFDITGLSNTEGSYAFIYTKAEKGITASSQTHTTEVKINGTSVSTIATSTGTAADTKLENYIIMYANGAWRISGYGPTAATNSTVDTADLAEWIPYTGEKPLEGEVLTVGDQAVSVKKSSSAYDKKLMGIVTTNPHTVMSADDGKSVKLALSGRVPVKVSAENGAIEAGDYLTSSSVPGVAMKATRAGFAVGKALESWTPESGKDTVMVLVETGYVDVQNVLASLSLDADGNLVMPNIDPEDEIIALGGNPASLPNTQKPKDLGWTLADIVRRLEKLEVGNGKLDNEMGSESAHLSPQSEADQDTHISSLTSQLSSLDSQVASLSAGLDLLQKSAAISDLSTLSDLSNLSSSSAQLGLAEGLSAKTATISGSLSVGGRTTLADVGIAGKMNIGLLAIEGLSDPSTGSGLSGEAGYATINTTSGKLHLQSDGINGIDILDGKVVIEPNGNMKVQGTVTVKKLNVDTSEVAGASVGEGILEAGTTSIVIDTTSVNTKSKIFVTSESDIDLPLNVISKLDKKSFTVKIKTAQSKDVKFNWFIVN